MASSEEGPDQAAEHYRGKCRFVLGVAHEWNPVSYDVVFCNPNFGLM